MAQNIHSPCFVQTYSKVYFWVMSGICSLSLTYEFEIIHIFVLYISKFPVLLFSFHCSSAGNLVLKIL